MARVRRLPLDVLKPHQPDVLELARLLANQGEQAVKITVAEMDEQTETLRVEISGDDIEQLRAVIERFGASLHSIDEVMVDNRSAPNT